MSKNRTSSGLGKVYKFTLSQLFKNKANIISFAIFAVIAIAAVPVLSIVMGGDSAQTGPTFTSEVMSMDDFLTRDDIGFDARYAIQYAYSIIVVMVTAFSCAYIVRSIIEEKASKLVETLMVSIKSEDMIMGKILAVMTFIFTMMGTVLLAFFASYKVTGMFMDTSGIANKLAGMGITADLVHISFGLVAVILISVLLAYATFALIAALSGASCSSMEDVESANMSATMIILVSYIATVTVLPFGSEAAAVALSLIPFVSAFAAPICYVLGDIGPAILIASWAIQAVCIFLIYKLSGKVYDNLVMYKGRRLKMRQVLAMAGSKKGGK